MGRPRKKRVREEEGATTHYHYDDEDTTTVSKNTMLERPPDTEELDLAAISLLMGEGGNGNYGVMGESGSAETDFPWGLYNTVDGLGDIAFDGGASSTEHLPSLAQQSHIDPTCFFPGFEEQPPPSADLSSHSHSPNTTTLESRGERSARSSSSSLPVPMSTKERCAAHTAALCLALEAMQNMPTGENDADVAKAMAHARRATRVAYDVVYCPACFSKLDDLPGDEDVHSEAAAADEIRGFQNLMLLATLIPSIAHAYEQMLVAADEAARRATVERRRLVFSLDGFGGLMVRDGGRCKNTEPLNHREMEPAMWRLTVRAMLRSDVYGMTTLSSGCGIRGGEERGAAGQPYCDHFGTSSAVPPLVLGLKDVVRQMEIRVRMRHAYLNAIAKRKGGQRCGGGQQDTTSRCEKIVAIAKAAIDGLVIP